MKKWEVLNSHYLYQTPYGNLRKDKCLVENGFVIDDYHVNEFDNWVNAVIITEQQEMVLVKQYRHGAGDFFYEIPAGKAEAGESYAEAIEREVLEETGYKSTALPIYLGEFFVNPATQNNKVISYMIPHAIKVDKQHLDPGEVIDIFTLPIENVEELIHKGELQQLFSVTAFYLAKKYNSRTESKS